MSVWITCECRVRYVPFASSFCATAIEFYAEYCKWFIHRFTWRIFRRKRRFISRHYQKR